MATEKKRVLLVDLSAVYWWKWHAAAGSDVDAAYRFTIEKVRALADGFEHVGICLDSPKSFRKELYPEYKANRPPREPAALEQLRRVEETLAADGFPLLKADGFEGDDVIATVTAWALGKELEVVIAGSDKDLYSLLIPGVALRQLVKDELWDGARVKAEIGVTPAQMRDYLSLVGDSSDNVKGAPGVGPKHAARLLAEYGTVANIYDKIDSVTPDSIRKSIEENEAAVTLAQKLISLRADAPVDCAKILEPRQPKEAVKPQMQDGDFEEAGKALAPLATVAPKDPEPSTMQQEALPKAPPAPLATIEPDPNDPRWLLAMEPKSSGQAYSLAKAIFASRLYQKFPNPEAIFAVILSGRSKGIDMMTALDGYHVIEGKPTMSAALIIATVMRSGKAEFFELIETTNEKATWETKRVGARKPLSITFTFADAQRAGLVKPRGNWEKYPRAMCQWRAGVELARAVYPDVVNNVYSPDELGDPSYVESTIVEQRKAAG